MNKRSSCAFIVSVVGALLAGCNGSQASIGLPGSGGGQSGEKTIVYSFAGGSDGAYPAAAPLSVNGEFFATTVLGGNGGCDYVGGCGTLYKVNGSGQESVLHVFKGGTDGEAPEVPLILSNGTLFGTTTLGGGSGCKNGHVSGCGTIFELTASGTERILYRFPGKPQGALPAANLTAFNGSLSGEAAAGGKGKCYYTDIPGCGTIFSMTPSGQVSTIYEFKGGTDAGSPTGGLVIYQGNLYGTSAHGGRTCPFSYGCGTVFKMTPSGSETILHRFTGSFKDGAIPSGGVVVLNGVLYGTTVSGGNHDCALTGSFIGCGTVFEVTRVRP